MSELFRRLKSFAWRMGGSAVLFVLGWIGENLGIFELDPLKLALIASLLGYITGEFTKWWAIHQSKYGRTFFGRVL